MVKQLEKDTVHFIAGDLRPYRAVTGTHFSSPICLKGLGRGYKKLMQRGRPTLPQRLFDRKHAKFLVKQAASAIEKIVRSIGVESSI